MHQLKDVLLRNLMGRMKSASMQSFRKRFIFRRPLEIIVLTGQLLSRKEVLNISILLLKQRVALIPWSCVASNKQRSIAPKSCLI